MTRRRLTPFWLIVLLAISCSFANAAQAPKNVILMIGDGMGLAQVTLARLMQSSGRLNMDSMPCTAFVKTHSADSMITDSAAAGTALATGFKTNNGMISTLPDGTSVESIMEAAAKNGKATGLVTTTTITHATPAVFGSHVANRGDEADIAPQYMKKNIDVLLGGGKAVFIPQATNGSKRKDDLDLIADARKAGYSVVDTRSEMLSAGGTKLLGLFHMSSLTTESPEPSLMEMSKKAVEVLSRDKDGFFLMVEGGQIDYKCHENNAVGAVKQLMDFDAAIGAALDFARKNGDTLVLVTADHETGGLTIVYPEKGSGERFAAKWSAGGHSACNVPLFADGPGSSSFDGVLDNTDIPKKIAQLWKISGFPRNSGQ